MADVVDILLRLRGARQFQSEAGKSAKALDKVGDEADTAGKKGKRGWKSMAGWAGGAAAFAGATAFAKGAVTSTTDLAKSTMALERSTGLSTETASAWGSVLKARGVDTKAFQIGMTKLSREMVKGAGKTEDYNKTFKKLGISQDTLKGGDINSVIMGTADAYAAMTNPAEKAALMQQLFGRQAQTLAPMMASGSEGIREQLEMAEKYGATLDEDAVGGAKDMIAKQREMKIAMEGLKTTFGTKLLPAILPVINAFARMVEILQPLLRNTTFVYIALGLLTAAFIALKVVAIATMIATSPITGTMALIALAIAAVVIGLILLYTKCEWFRNALAAVWEWIKTAAVDTFKWVKKAFEDVVSFIGGLPEKISRAASGMWNGIKDAFKSVFNWIIGKWNGLQFTMPEIDTHIPGVGKIGGFTIGVPDIPLMATGGTITRAGAAVVGDKGPELITMPRGASVIPLPQVSPVGGVPALDGGQGQTIVTKVFLDRRQIAEAVGTYVSDKRARR